MKELKKNERRLSFWLSYTREDVGLYLMTVKRLLYDYSLLDLHLVIGKGSIPPWLLEKLLNLLPTSLDTCSYPFLFQNASLMVSTFVHVKKLHPICSQLPLYSFKLVSRSFNWFKCPPNTLYFIKLSLPLMCRLIGHVPRLWHGQKPP